jgi:hypothetical protein
LDSLLALINNEFKALEGKNPRPHDIVAKQWAVPHGHPQNVAGNHITAEEVDVRKVRINLTRLTLTADALALDFQTLMRFPETHE